MLVIHTCDMLYTVMQSRIETSYYVAKILLTGLVLSDPKHEQRADLLPRVTLQSPSKSAPFRPCNVCTFAPLSPFDRKKLCLALLKKLNLLSLIFARDGLSQKVMYDQAVMNQYFVYCLDVWLKKIQYPVSFENETPRHLWVLGSFLGELKLIKMFSPKAKRAKIML